ncbi:thiamine ABC transporter permease [Vibrio caribbeanicus]|uniref:Thiamine ABC transporter permease n=1 Tax=Vibrio caribbeanicus TaxID=701175 RepID=A0ACC4NWC3_9VIBR|nr:thiamine ABC transporter permease [Vibrio caribbeanicus]KHD24756.1 thiamine ABC transporter permease [Vibrio caribbeanicus]
MFRAAYLLLIFIVILPTLPGILGVMLSSVGYLPPIGSFELSLSGYRQALAWPGFMTSSLLTIFSALVSTYLSLALCFMVLQSLWNSRRWKYVENLLSPLLAVPHVAFAIGFAFLFASTGLSNRVLNTLPWFQGDHSVASWLVHDPFAIGLTLALALKELPFLLLMSIPILHQINVDNLAKVSTSLGYSPHQFWWKVVLPQWLNKMRFPLFAVIAYGASVVDFALVLGPTTPPTLAVLVWQWFTEPDLSLLPRAAAGAMLLFVICACLLLTVYIVERYLVNKKSWQYSGRFGLRLPGTFVVLSIAFINVLLMPIMAIWSVAHRWRFPDLLPSNFSFRFWANESGSFLPILGESINLALISALIALSLAILAHEYRLKHRLHLPSYVIALPMLMPQLSLLFGLQVSTLYVSNDSYYVWVIWSHVFFAFPFVYLALDGSWKSYNNQYSQVALSLGKTPWQVFVQIKAKILLQPIFYAWAIGASVSLAQYLPTLMLGAGRIATITTEAVALSSGYDRRVTAIYALWQALLPFAFFSLAILLPRFYLSRKKAPQIIHKESRINDATARKHRHP